MAHVPAYLMSMKLKVDAVNSFLVQWLLFAAKNSPAFFRLLFIFSFVPIPPS